MTTKTLDQALRETYQKRWRYQKSCKSTLSQASAAARDLEHRARSRLGLPTACSAAYPPCPMDQITPQDLAATVSIWYAEGLTPATINKRLNCLSALGIKVQGYRLPKDRKPKWYLSEDARRAVLSDLSDRDEDADWLVGSFIRWTTRTGLRVEETLRLRWGDFVFAERNHPLARPLPAEVRVPGTKTGSAQATLPLGKEAIEALPIKGLDAGPFADLTYDILLAKWNGLREAYQWPEGATLKALRRSAARYLHVDCGMPLHMVQQYLRHESLDTTLEYLRLTGGYGTEEMRRYLK